MQRVIHLIEALRSADIPVPPYPYAEPEPAVPSYRPAQSESDLQAKVDAFEARVQAWRQEVVALHRLHFPTGDLAKAPEGQSRL
jgi:hypothetical protein